MSSASRLPLVLALAGFAGAADFRVCADPNNMPFSNAQGEGFENALARLITRDMGRQPRFVWASQRGAYLKKNLDAGRCDAVMGVPSALGNVRTTRPYYRSSYAFVYRRGHLHQVRSFTDPALRSASIGVQLVQNDGAVTPPAQALIREGLERNLRWYKLFPDFSRPNPSSALLEAVERGDIDVAVAWGPVAGYFARHAATPLTVVSVPRDPATSVPLAFDISVGVRRSDEALVNELNRILSHRRPEIRALLRDYGVPLDVRPAMLPR